MRSLGSLAFFVIALANANAQPPNQRGADVAQIIESAVNPGQLPAGFKGMVIGYLDDFGPVYKAYGIATVDKTVPLNERTLFGIGSLTKLFSATLLGIANEKGLDLATPVTSLLPAPIAASTIGNRGKVRLLDLADHHAGLPKNEGHLYNSVSDLYTDFAADPVTCAPSTSELVHDCGCCDPVYMSLLGLTPTCGAGVPAPVYSCPTHAPTQGAKGFVYSNLGFEVLGATVATWLGYSNWADANLHEITQPLNMMDTMPLESFGDGQTARAANHCSPATRTTNVNCHLLNWLPVGNGAGGLFSTAQDMLTFLSYNAFGKAGAQPDQTLVNALPIVHQNYETTPGGGQELAWQTFTLRNGDFEHWKDGANGPFNSWAAYVSGPVPRMVVLLDNSGTSNANLSAIGANILVGTGPSITSITTANGGADIAQNTWIVIKGNNLAPSATPASGRNWSSAPEFAMNQLPAQLGDVSVTVNGKPAYVYFYCSAVTSSSCASDQINVLTPLDNTTGQVMVSVTNGTARSPAFPVNLKSTAPAFLLFNQLGNVAATHANGSILGPVALFPGLSSPARPGEQVVLYGVGFGLPAGQLADKSSMQSGPLPSLPVCRVGGAVAAVGFAGLISPGLYQINLSVPVTAANGEQPVSCVYNGVSTQTGSVIAVEQ